MINQVTNIEKKRVGIPAFYGYNHTLSPKVGEFFNLNNVTNDYFPLLSPREKRTEFADLSKIRVERGNSEATAGDYVELNIKSINSIIRKSYDSGDRLFVICKAEETVEEEDEESGKITQRTENINYLGNYIVDDGTFWAFDDFNKSNRLKEDNNNFYVMGNKAIILPDKKYLDFSNFNISSIEFGNHIDSTLTGEVAVPKDKSEDYNIYLNIGFRYALENEDGTYTYIPWNDPDIKPSTYTADRYYVDSNGVLKKYVKSANASYEISAPKVEMIFKWDIEAEPYSGDRIDELNLENGNTFTFKLGKVLNTNHPLKENKEHLGDCGDDETINYNLKFLKYVSWEDTATWENGLIVDYNAKFIKFLKDNKLFLNSLSAKANKEHYAPIMPSYIEIDKAIPTLTNYVEHNNRIWGTDNELNEIKACSQGSFKNWDDYSGIASDSYSATVGTDGDFNASCVIGDYIFFFKEHSYSQLYGTKPSNYCINSVTDFIGIGADSSNSLQSIGNYAYYLGIDGRVYRFNGQTSELISDCFGDERYSNGHSAHCNGKYYLSCTGKDKENVLFVYDILKGLWTKQDYVAEPFNLNGAVCCNTAGKIIEIDSESLNKGEIVDGEDNLKWYAETGNLGIELDYKQYISNIYITLDLEKGSKVKVMAKFDKNASYELLDSFSSESLCTKKIRIPTKKCSYFKLKLCGTGQSKIYRLSYEVEQGSEL